MAWLLHAGGTALIIGAGLTGGSITLSSGADITANMGALTPAGEGGVAVTGTSITSGDASGHFQITSGYLEPSSTGAAANLNLGPYSLTLNNGQTVDITITANEMHARTWAEATAHITTGNQGNTIRLRESGSPYDTGDMGSLGSTLSATVNIRSENDDKSAVILRKNSSYHEIDVGGMDWIDFHYVSFEFKQQGLAFQQTKRGFLEGTGGGNWGVYNSRIFGDIDPWRLGGTPEREWCGLFLTNASNVTIEDCEIDHVVHGINWRGGDDFVSRRNNIHHFWSDGHQVVNNAAAAMSNITIEYNHIHDYCGDYLFLHPDLLVQTFNSGSNTGDIDNLVLRGNVGYPGYEGVRSAPNQDGSTGAITWTTALQGGTRITTNTTLDSSYVNKLAEVVATGGTVTITLPAANVFTNGQAVAVRRHPTSDSDVVVQRAGSDTLLGGTSVTLDSGDPYLTAQSNGSNAYTAGTTRLSLQGILLQDLNGGDFNDPVIEGNILYLIARGAAILGNSSNGANEVLGTGSVMQYNSFIPVFPGDITGNGTPDEAQDGAAQFPQFISAYSDANLDVFRNACGGTEDNGGSGTPTFTGNHVYSALTLASIQLAYNHSGSTLNPTTYDEAISLARPKTSGPLDQTTYYIGAIGTTDGNGFLDPTAKALN